ncbi:Uncharacterised protein [Vibrio cholerae]|nr:Uncharacterised protein [Vibrio cholerae]
MAIFRLDQRFQFTLFFSQSIKVCIRLSVRGINFIKTLKRVSHIRNGFFDNFTYGFTLIQLRLLGQITHFQTGLWTSFTVDVFVNACHDTQQGRFTRTVKAQNTNFGTREETQGDIFQNLTLGWHNLAHPRHGIYVFSHCRSFLIFQTE